MTIGPNESFRGYAQKWRDLDGRVRPPLTDREMIDIFTGTLMGPFFKHLIRSSSAEFTELILTGERVEADIKSGKIQGATPYDAQKNPYNGKKSPMQCMVKWVVMTNTWGQFWSLFLHRTDDNKGEINEGQTSPKDSLPTSTCRCLKHCNTCWTWIWLHW